MALKTRNIPGKVVRFQKRLEKWRRSREKGPCRIPEALWSEATRLSLETSPYVVSRAGRLDYTALKRRMDAFSGTRPPARIPTGFFEVVPSAPDVPWNGAVLELSDEAGRMVVRFSPAVDVNAAVLISAFRNRQA